MNRHGEFVVAYEQPTPLAPGRVGPGDVFVRIYDRKGRASGGPIQASVDARSGGLQPAVAVDDAGGFVVAWVGTAAPGATPPEIFARRFDRTGNPLGGEFQVNTFVPGFHASPDVAADHSGNFVITWTQSPGRGQQVSQDGNGAGV